MRLYFVRHGETDWNKARRVQGHADIELNEYGRYLAEETAKGMKDTLIDLAYTSPLVRAKETAELILAGREIPIVEEERIKELSFGKAEGLCCSGENQEEGSEEFMKFFTDTANYVPAEGGETIEVLLERTGDFLHELYEDPKMQDKNILISSHGAALTALLNHIRGNLSVADFWGDNVPPNCAVTTVEVTAGEPKIIEENRVYYKEPVHSWKVEES